MVEPLVVLKLVMRVMVMVMMRMTQDGTTWRLHGREVQARDGGGGAFVVRHRLEPLTRLTGNLDDGQTHSRVRTPVTLDYGVGGQTQQDAVVAARPRGWLVRVPAAD